ncbi:MAG: hypothetical protein QM756_29595 [Polyangiaceae bacterium]
MILPLLLPPERLDAFAKGTGVDLRQVESGLIAGFDLGTLYVVSPPRGSAPQIVEHFRERILNGEHRQFPHPDLERVYGVVGTTPELLVRVDQHLVAVATRDPTPARVVEAFARSRLKTSPTALHGAALSTLSPPPADAFVTFYAPGPFDGEWSRGARGLLANALAARVSLAPRAPNKVAFVVELTGEFPATGADDLAEAFKDSRHEPARKAAGPGPRRRDAASARARAKAGARRRARGRAHRAWLARRGGFRRVGDDGAATTVKMRKQRPTRHTSIRCAQSTISAQVFWCRT